MSNRTTLHLAFLSALLLASLAAFGNAQEKVKEKKEKAASDPAVTARVAKLIKALKDKDGFVRLSATGALKRIGPAAVSALIETLKGKERNVREGAAQALGQIDPAAKDAVPALKAKSEKDPEAGVREVAAEALKSINK
jgi:HEAT repeat protein